MESLDRATDIESKRMELRGVVRLAGEVIAQYWPMRTFVHHNPLHSLEYLPFEETVRRGKQFMGGSGYLPSEVYRHYLRSGRIRPEHLDAVLGPLAQHTRVQHVFRCDVVNESGAHHLGRQVEARQMFEYLLAEKRDV